MASIEKRKLKHGVSHVVVFYRNGKKEKVSFGKRYKLSDVKAAKAMIEAYVDAEQTGEPLSRVATEYFENAPKDLIKRFSCLGFGNASVRTSIDDAWKAFVVKLEQTVKGRTCDTYRTAYERFRAFFKVDDFLDSITDSEVEAFANELRLRYASGTVDQTSCKLRAFSTWAFKQGFSSTDVLKSLPRDHRVNREHAFYVDRETAFKLIETAPTKQWKLLIACWRFLGMRREEPFDLTCESFDWDRKVVRVHARKTEHCSNGGNRETPMFPDFQNLAVNCAFNDPLFNGINKTSVYDCFKTIVIKSGCKPWDKLIQNLRASCENDLVSVGFPNHVVASWVGHSVEVQKKHYLQVTSVYLNKATSENLWDNL